MTLRPRLNRNAALAGLAGAVVLGLLAWLPVQMDRATKRLRTIELEFDITTQQMLVSVGFDGMIHNFKNCVLRPEEPRYCTEAATHAAQALGLLARMEEIAGEAGTPLDVSDVRAAVLAYAEAAPQVRAAHDQGLSVREIDALVRYDDLPATNQLDATLEVVRVAMQDRVTEFARTLRWLSALGIAIVFLGMAAVLYIIRREARRSAARERRLDGVFSALSGALIGLDGDGRIMLANAHARRLFRLGQGPVPLDWPTGFSFHWQDGDQGEFGPSKLVDHLLGAEPLRSEIMRMHDSAGESRDLYLSLTSAPVDMEPAGLHRILLIDDVSTRERSRQQIERNSRLEALGQLTGGIAHDFNNLLATILYATELAQRKVSDEDTRSMLERILSSVARGRDLTERLLSFARRQPGRNRSWPADQVIEEFRILARPAVEETIALSFEVAEPDLYVFCDRPQLENALLNLVLNSRDAIRESRRGDTIGILVRGVTSQNPVLIERQGGEPPVEPREHRFIEIAVADNGPGMTEDVRRRATDPFFTTRAESGGSGLGLAMVYGFVQQSRGELQIYSDEGRGTTVRMILPRGTPEHQREAPQHRPDVPHGSGQTVLLVEDEPDLLETMSRMLDDMGYRVMTAGDGKAALDLVDEGMAFDILLSDIVMPRGVDGIELARQVRDRFPDRGIILMSGYVSLSGDSDARETDEFIVLQKPCKLSDLAAALWEVSPV
ncbi:response regulator [Marinibacterium sp. SX1]|uniref:response regulator n=1 Tax=Marinibacterium sp. SX1 TaxID=3388424 RepID=UPI003D181559